MSSVLSPDTLCVYATAYRSYTNVPAALPKRRISGSTQKLPKRSCSFVAKLDRRRGNLQ